MIRPLLPGRVRVVEVGPRDGLQNEQAPIDMATKVALVDALSDAGLPVIEVGAFVSPRWVPQMADTGEVFARIRRVPGVQYTALVPNATGLRRAIAAGVTEVAISPPPRRASAGRTSTRPSRIAGDVRGGRTRRGTRRAARSCVPLDGVRVSVPRCRGCRTGGIDCRAASRPRRLPGGGQRHHRRSASRTGVGRARGDWSRLPLSDVALHFHDTRGGALANVLAALQAGITTFDASAGGLGGCPYAPGAAGISPPRI